MAAHRYWRVVGLEAYAGGDIELSALQLRDSGGARVDASATLTATVDPDVSGALANLQDGVLSTAARWSQKLVRGLVLQWDFGVSPIDAVLVQLGGDSEARFPLIGNLQASDNGTSWATVRAYAGITWPGVGAFTGYALTPDDSVSVYPETVLISSPYLYLKMSELSGVFADESGNGRSGSFVGSATRGSPPLRAGSAGSVSFDGTDSYVHIQTLTGHTDSMAFECVFSVPDLLDVQPLMARGVKGVDWSVYFEVLATGSLSFGIVTTSGGATLVGANSATGLIVANQKYHAVARWSSAVAMTVWLDGVLVATTSTTRSSLRNTSDGLYVGKRVGTLGKASISDAAFYNYALSTSDIQAHASERTDPPASVLSTTMNKIRGRAATGQPLALYSGSPTPLGYGNPDLVPAYYFNVESGSVKDQITGVLGEGIGRVKGTVATKGSLNQFVHRKVRLIRERDGLVVREAWSNATTGEYDFQWVDEAQTFTVVSYDHLHNYRAVIADNLTPELMP